MNYEDYIQKYIFDPSGMNNTRVQKSEKDIISNPSIGMDMQPDKYGVNDLSHANYFNSYSLSGGGSVFSNVDDMYKFFIALQNGRLFSNELVEKMKN